MSDLDKAIRDLIDDESERAEVERLINHHAPSLDDLDREDLINDLMQLFRPDGPGCWAEDDAEESTSGVSGEDRSEPTPAPREWRVGQPPGDLLNPVIRTARLVVTEEFAATSFVHRKLDLGWRLAEDCLLLLETWGVVEPTTGSKSRRVRDIPMSELEDLVAALTASSEVVTPEGPA